jgi:hypothetical protein
MLGFIAFTAAWIGLRGVGHPWLGPSVAIVAAVLGLVFGAVARTWGTAALVAALFASAAGAAVAALKHAWLPVAAVAFSLGLFVGVRRQQKLEIYLPPVFAGLFAALGAAIGWGPHRRGAALYWLNDVDWVLGLFAALAVPLLVLAVVRERWRRAKLAVRTAEMDDDDLKAALAAKQPEFERAALEAAAATTRPPGTDEDV